MLTAEESEADRTQLLWGEPPELARPYVFGSPLFAVEALETTTERPLDPTGGESRGRVRQENLPDKCIHVRCQE